MYINDCAGVCSRSRAQLLRSDGSCMKSSMFIRNIRYHSVYLKMLRLHSKDQKLWFREPEQVMDQVLLFVETPWEMMGDGGWEECVNRLKAESHCEVLERPTGHYSYPSYTSCVKILKRGRSHGFDRGDLGKDDTFPEFLMAELG